MRRTDLPSFRDEGAGPGAAASLAGEPWLERLRAYWFVACRSKELARSPIRRTVLGSPLVLFRDSEGRPAALLDRCAHRNAPLSAGRIAGGRLQCPYHGWKYDPRGVCVEIPGLLSPLGASRPAVPAYPAVERQGWIWVWGTPGGEPRGDPYEFPGGPGGTTIEFSSEVPAPLPAVLENMLDVPHTAFLHRGWFRGAGRQSEIEATLRSWGDRVEVEYRGERRPSGWIARLLAPGRQGTVEHYDRFRLPSIVEVEYRLGPNRLLACAASTPVDEWRTRVHAVVEVRVRLPASWVRLVVAPVARRIFAQDLEILRLQADNLRRFGGPRYASTELDLLGPEVQALLASADRIGAVPGEALRVERTVRFIA